MAYYLHTFRSTPLEEISGRYFYTIILAGASIVIALMLFAPFDHTFRHFPLDFLLSVGWFVAFGLLLSEFSATDSATQDKIGDHWPQEDIATRRGQLMVLRSSVLVSGLLHLR